MENNNCDQRLKQKEPNLKLNEDDVFGLLASETNQKGYKQSFCMQCVVSDGFQEYKFKFDSLKVEGLKLNCSESLKPKNIVVNEVLYDKKGSVANIFPNKQGYVNLFVHKQEHDCPVDRC